MSEPITGSLAGVTFAFDCDVPDLEAYARLHLAPLATTGPGAAMVHTRLRWHDGQPPVRRPAATELRDMERVDRDLYVAPDCLRWFRIDDIRDLHLQVGWRDGWLSVLGDFYYRLGNSRVTDTIRRLRQWQRRDVLRARRFTTLLAYLVYYPCWWWLEQMREFHPIHAAGVASDAGTVLLAGASGAGKSTLAVALALSPGARLLSDSFVLHRGTDVLPVREPVLLDAFSRRWLGPSADSLVALGRRYALKREGYQLPADRLAERGRVGLLLFPRRATTAYVRQIPAAQAHHRLSAADLIVNDLRRYWAFAAILEQMVPAGLMARREAQLARLTADVPCYEIGLTAEMSSRAVAESVVQLMGDTPLRAAGAHP